MDKLARIRAQLRAWITIMNKPLPRSYDAVMPCSYDDEVFFHHPDDDFHSSKRLWKHQIVAFNPKNGQFRKICLPKEINMVHSKICQIAREIYLYSKDKDRTKVLKIQGLSSGTPRSTEMTSIDDRAYEFSLAVDSRRYIYMSGG